MLLTIVKLALHKLLWERAIYKFNLLLLFLLSFFLSFFIIIIISNSVTWTLLQSQAVVCELG